MTSYKNVKRMRERSLSRGFWLRLFYKNKKCANSVDKLGNGGGFTFVVAELKNIDKSQTLEVIIFCNEDLDRISVNHVYLISGFFGLV